MFKLLLIALALVGCTNVTLFAQDGAKGSSDEQKVFQVENIALLNSSSEFGLRAGSIQIVAGYIKSIEAKLTSIVETEFADKKTPQNGLVAVAIRPGGSSKLWVDVGDKFNEDLTTKLEKSLADTGTPQVAGGPVAFTVNFQIWGGVTKAEKEKGAGVAPPAIPASWKKALKANNKPPEEGKKLKVPDDVLPLVWPEESQKNDSSDVFVPEGFVLQKLEPLGGNILRPKDWHYSQGSANQSVIWTISKEPAESYVTGVRVQLVVGVKKATGKTPEEFVQRFVDGKKKQTKVLSQHKAMKQGGFTRVGIETQEPQPGAKDAPPFRILYSCFWNNEMDMVAITISGTTTDLWEEYQETFGTMAGLTIVDLKKAKAMRE